MANPRVELPGSYRDLLPGHQRVGTADPSIGSKTVSPGHWQSCRSGRAGEHSRTYCAHGNGRDFRDSNVYCSGKWKKLLTNSEQEILRFL